MSDAHLFGREDRAPVNIDGEIGASLSRRQVAKGALWAAPAIVLATSLPAAAVSNVVRQVFFSQVSGALASIRVLGNPTNLVTTALVSSAPTQLTIRAGSQALPSGTTISVGIAWSTAGLALGLPLGHANRGGFSLYQATNGSTVTNTQANRLLLGSTAFGSLASFSTIDTTSTFTTLSTIPANAERTFDFEYAVIRGSGVALSLNIATSYTVTVSVLPSGQAASSTTGSIGTVVGVGLL